MNDDIVGLDCQTLLERIRRAAASSVTYTESPMQLTPAEQMLYSATRIATFRRGAPLAFGTGFFYLVRLDDERSTTLLVTNRHVFEGCDRIDLTLHLRDSDQMVRPSGSTYTWQLEFTGEPIGHPDPNVDLAVISVTDLHRSTAAGKQFPFYVAFTREQIPAAGDWAAFDAIEEVTMVGCPNGLFDASNNLPLLRRGITATHPAMNYQGREEFMVDLACFPGSSGSPIFLYSTGASYDREARSYSLGKIRLFLLGILHAGPTITQNGEIVLARRPSVSVSVMMHLGVAIKSTQLLAFDELVRQRMGIED